MDAPLIDELSVAVECKLKDYNPETCILRGEIVNVSVDERVLDQNGKVDASKVIPVIFDPFNNDYLKVGEKVGNAFSDGKAFKITESDMIQTAEAASSIQNKLRQADS